MSLKEIKVNNTLIITVDNEPDSGSENLIISDAVNQQYSLIVAIASKLNLKCRYPSDVTYIDKNYLSNVEHPALTPHNLAKVTSPIKLNSGETIVFRVNGSGICFIAETDASGESYTNLVGGSASSNNIYTYTAAEDCYVALSGVYMHNPVDYIGFEFGIIWGTAVTDNIEELDQRITEIESQLPKGNINIFNGQSAGDLLVTYNTSSSPVFNIISYSESHFTAKIPIKNGVTYIMPYFNVAAYNFVLADEIGNINRGYTGGKMSTEEYAIGSNVQLIEDKLYFIAPASNLYLYINLKFSTYLNVLDNFYLLEKTDMSLQEHLDKIDERLDTIEENLPQPTDIYTEQSAGNYLVSFTGSSFSIVSYSDSHFTTLIPLVKDGHYRFPYYDIAAYNFAVADENRSIISNFTGGKATTAGSQYYIGTNIQLKANELCFISPSDDLYLFINLQFGSSGLNVLNNFYLLEETELSLPEHLEQIDLKNEQQDHRLDVLEDSVGGDTRFSSKTIYVFGDSITWLGGDDCDGTRSGYEHKGWTEYFKERIKPLTMRSYARSGATLCCFSTSSENTSLNVGGPHKDNIVWNQIKRMQNDINNGHSLPDYIIIAAGINDAMIINSTDPQSAFYELNQVFQNALTGAAEDILNGNISTSYFDSKTPSECDSLLKTIRWIKDACISICPNAQIVFLTPLLGALAPLSLQKQVSDIIEESSSYISASVINQRKECGISRLQESKRTYFTYDGTHTSIDGAKRVGYILAEMMKSIFY